ncbi:MAG: AAA family ATPase, partial [bacterium]
VAAAQVAGLGEHEALATFTSGWAAGTAKPRHAPQDRPMPVAEADGGCHEWTDVLDAPAGERTVQAPAAYAATMPDQVQEPGPAAVQARFQVVDSARWHETEPPPMRWLFEGMIPSGVLAGLTAMGGSGKSWLALEISMSLAAGVTILPSFAPMGPAPVLAILGEDGEDEVHRRYRRVLRAFPTLADRADLIAENLHLVCGVAAPLAGHDAARDVRGTQAYAALQELVDDYEPSLLVIDPKAQFFGLDESSNDETVQWYGLLRRLRTDMTTLVTQHVSKAKENSMDSGASRGASANRDDCRAMLNLGVISKEIATAIAAKGECVNDFIAIDLVKSNYSARLRAPVLLRRILDSPGCPEHETMGGVMMEVAVPKVAGETEAMHLVAATIGTNPENLGKNQIAREDSAIRSALLVQGIRVKDIGRLIDAAVAAKLLYYDPVPGAGKPKQVPRRTES